jgi:hypothetical protein
MSIIFFIGCGSTAQVKVDKKVKVQKKVVEKVIIKKNHPDWVDNPNIGGEDGVVGIVKLMKNKKKQEYIATRLAIALYQEQKRVTVNTTVKTNEVVAGGKIAKSTSSQITRQTSSHFQTNKLIKKAEFSDKDNYYIWMVVSK